MAKKDTQHQFARRFVILTVLLAIATLLATLAPLHWFAELFSHFKPHYAVAGLIFALALAMARRPLWAALALALMLWNGYPVARLLLKVPPPAASTSAGANRITLFQFNAHFENADLRRLTTHLLRAKDIDVVVLLEAGSPVATVLSEIKDVFPHQVTHLEDSPFGIAIASRHPLDFGAVSRESTPLYPHIEATVKIPGRAAPLALYAVHAPPPINAEMADDRNRKLAHVARKVSAQAAMTPVVLGDFNLTPWSPYFERFVADSGLADARTPHRFEHTWPVTFNNAHLGLALDHSFAHPGLRLIKRTIGPDLGSDHMPVTVTFGY